MGTVPCVGFHGSWFGLMVPLWDFKLPSVGFHDAQWVSTMPGVGFHKTRHGLLQFSVWTFSMPSVSPQCLVWVFMFFCPTVVPSGRQQTAAAIDILTVECRAELLLHSRPSNMDAPLPTPLCSEGKYCHQVGLLHAKSLPSARLQAQQATSVPNLEHSATGWGGVSLAYA